MANGDKDRLGFFIRVLRHTDLDQTDIVKIINHPGVVPVEGHAYF